MTRYQLHDVGLAYRDVAVLSGVTLGLQAGELVTIVGPNGAGKSTLLGILAGLRTTYTGSCRYGEKEVRQWKRRELACRVAFVPQSIQIDFPFTAEQVVMMGRAPHADRMFESENDREVALDAMRKTGTLTFRNRDFRSLSGGERQRVILAAALAQSPQALLLDEPTTYLDLHHQLSLYHVLQILSKQGILIVAVTHDLNLAATYATRVIVLHQGRVASDAAPSEALNPASISRVFQVQTQLLSDASGRHWIHYGE